MKILSKKWVKGQKAPSIHPVNPITWFLQRRWILKIPHQQLDQSTKWYNDAWTCSFPVLGWKLWSETQITPELPLCHFVPQELQTYCKVMEKRMSLKHYAQVGEPFFGGDIQHSEGWIMQRSRLYTSDINWQLHETKDKGCWDHWGEGN